MLLSSGRRVPFNLVRMTREIRPEPSSDELQAIEEALLRLTSPPADARSSWWRVGVAESLSEEEEPA